MNTIGLQWHRRAQQRLLNLEEAEKRTILSQLTALANLSRSQWPEGIAFQMPTEPTLLLLRLDNGWRAIVEMDCDQIREVQDLVRQEMLDAFRRDYASTSAS